MPKSRLRISRAGSNACGPAFSSLLFAAMLAMSAAMAGPAAAAEEHYRVRRVPDTWAFSASEDSIYFDLGSSLIDEAAAQIIQRHVAKLRSAPDLQIVVIAHTDNLGSASIELATGQERLDAVRKRLEESKIAPERIRMENHGSESRSDQPCAKEDCRRKKRRVDFLLQR